MAPASISTLFVSILMHAALSEAASEEGGGGSKSTFEVGATALSQYPLQVTTLLIGVITVAVIAELIVEHLKHEINDAFQRIVDAVTNEVMILGVVSIFLFLLEDTKAWDDARIDGEPVDVHVVHFIHMALFLVALFYIFSNISLIVLMKRTADRWASYEAFCIEDERTMNNSMKEHQTSRKSFESANSDPDWEHQHRNSDCDMSNTLKEILVDMDTRLKVYTDWRSSASVWDILKNLSKVKQGRELKRAVQFRHIRSFFLSQGRRRNSIADIEHILHNRFRFSNFLYRCAVQDLNKCSSIGIKVWCFLGLLIGIDALRIEVAILIAEKGYHHDFHPNPLHDIYYWISIQYAVLFFLMFMSRVVKKAWSVFKQQNETAVRISQKLRRSVTDKTIREVVRKKMLEKEIRIIKAEEFQKLFLFNSPEMTFTFIKIGIMVCCWTLMLYILGYSKQIWEPDFLHPGKAFLLTMAYIAPTVYIFWFIIPETIEIMSILMSARDLSLATPQEKKTLVELMRISMSEELTLFKQKKNKRRSTSSIARASDEIMVPREAVLPPAHRDADDTPTVASALPQTQQRKPFSGGASLSIDTDNDQGNEDTPYSPTVIYSETPKAEQSTASKLLHFLPTSPNTSKRKTVAGNRPMSMPANAADHGVTPSPAPMSRPGSMRRRGSMTNLSRAKSFFRDHLLSETEAAVERIRHHEVESDDEEEAQKEWEKRRRIAAFARYGEMAPQIAGDVEPSFLPAMRERSISRESVSVAQTSTRERGTSSPYQKMQYVEEGNEDNGSDSEVEAVVTVVKDSYGSGGGDYAELKDVEMGEYPVQVRSSAMFREVSSKEDPALRGGQAINEDVAQRIIRENNLDALFADDDESKLQI